MYSESEARDAYRSGIAAARYMGDPVKRQKAMEHCDALYTIIHLYRKIAAMERHLLKPTGLETISS